MAIFSRQSNKMAEAPDKNDTLGNFTNISVRIQLLSLAAFEESINMHKSILSLEATVVQWIRQKTNHPEVAIRSPHPPPLLRRFP